MTKFLKEFLKLLNEHHSEGWFHSDDLSLCYFSRVIYNLDRLVELGKLESKVYGNIYSLKTKYRIIK